RRHRSRTRPQIRTRLPVPLLTRLLTRPRQAPASGAAHRSYLKGYLIFEIASAGTAHARGVRRTRIGACFLPASPVPHRPLPHPVESDSLPNLLGRESLSTSFRSVRYAPFAGIGSGVAVRGNDGLPLDAAAAREAAGGTGSSARGSGAARGGVGWAARRGSTAQREVGGAAVRRGSAGGRAVGAQEG